MKAIIHWNVLRMLHRSYIFSCCSALSLNVSKESLPNETSILHTKNSRTVHNEAISPDKGNDPAEQDDFSDIVDYIMLDTKEREKYKLDLDKIYPVVGRTDGPLKKKNPTLGQLKNLKLE